MNEAIESITATLPSKVFYGEDGTTLILVEADNYLISVDQDGHTNSTYLVWDGSVLDEENAGWQTGWET